MGLLDFTDMMGSSFDDPKAMGLLAIANRLSTSPKFVQGLSGGLLEAGQISANAKKTKLLEQMQAMQMEQQQMALQQQRAAMARQQEEQALIRQYARSPTQTALSGGGGPTMANAEKLQTAGPSFDFGGYAQALAGVDPNKSLAMQAALRKEGPKFSTAPQYDQNGRAFVLAEDGSMRYLNGVSARDKLISEDLGGQKVFRTEYSPNPMGALNKSVTPDALLGANTTMRGQNMTDERSREANALTNMNGRIPPGYRMTAAGNLEAIPGGPADIKAGELGAKMEAKKSAQISQANSVLDTVKEAKNLVGYTTSGFGGMASVIPATDARNLAGKIETIKANLGFDRLQQMRDSSPTGGALGAVAVQELTALQSTVASLDQKQSPAQLKAALEKIDEHYGKWLEVMGAPRKQGADIDVKKLYEDADAIILGR